MDSRFNYSGDFFPFLWFLGILVVVDIVVRGLALWRAGRLNQPRWFIALFIFNTVGILPAIYLLFFQNKKGRKA